MPKAVAAQLIFDQIEAIDYGNFKSMILERLGSARHDICSDAWGVFLRIQHMAK